MKPGSAMQSKCLNPCSMSQGSIFLSLLPDNQHSSQSGAFSVPSRIPFFKICFRPSTNISSSFSHFPTSAFTRHSIDAGLGEGRPWGPAAHLGLHLLATARLQPAALTLPPRGATRSHGNRRGAHVRAPDPGPRPRPRAAFSRPRARESWEESALPGQREDAQPPPPPPPPLGSRARRRGKQSRGGGGAAGGRGAG